MIEAIIQYLSDLPTLSILTALFVMIFMENITPFVPGDTFLAFSAYLSGTGVLPPMITYSTSVVGSLTGFALVYWLGFHWGREYFEKRNLRFFTTRNLQKADRYYDRFGDTFILMNRFLPGFRFLAALLAGFTRAHYIRTFLFSLISILAWNGLIFSAGRYLGKNWREIRGFLQQYNRIVLIIIAVFIAISLFLYQYYRKVKKKPHDDGQNAR